MGGRQRGDSLNYGVIPYSRNPNGPDGFNSYLEPLLDSTEEMDLFSGIKET